MFIVIRFSFAFAAVVCLAIPLGCASNAKSPASGEVTTAEKIRELRAQRRRDRARLRQLEEAMADAARANEERGHTPSLPVQRLDPEPDPMVAEEVVAVAEDGTEIVYVGEAAQEATVVANTSMLREPSRVPAPRRTKREVRRTPIKPPPVVASARGDSLGVTSIRLPRVGEVTKSAPPSPKARQATTASRLRPRLRGSRTTPASAVAEYQRNVRALKAGDHDEAITGFRRFVRRYARSDYADNAQYWLGEAFYDRKMFAKALVEFEKVQATYPSGNKVPDSMLKAAYCKIGLGDEAGARSLLSDIVSQFPDSRIATLASEKLERLAD